MQRLKHLRIDFAPEWAALLVLAAFDFAWARAIGFHLTITWSNGKLIGGPVFGGHYLTDMIAGAGVMLASLGLIKFYAWMRVSAANAWPKFSAMSAGAY